MTSGLNIFVTKRIMDDDLVKGKGMRVYLFLYVFFLFFSFIGLFTLN